MTVLRSIEREERSSLTPIFAGHAQHTCVAHQWCNAQEAVRNREIQARDLQTMTVLSEVAPRVRSASPASGGARTGAAAADRLRELGAAFEAVLAATGACTGPQGF